MNCTFLYYWYFVLWHNSWSKSELACTFVFVMPGGTKWHPFCTRNTLTFSRALLNSQAEWTHGTCAGISQGKCLLFPQKAVLLRHTNTVIFHTICKFKLCSDFTCQPCCTWGYTRLVCDQLLVHDHSSQALSLKQCSDTFKLCIESTVKPLRPEISRGKTQKIYHMETNTDWNWKWTQINGFGDSKIVIILHDLVFHYLNTCTQCSHTV